MYIHTVTSVRLYHSYLSCTDYQHKQFTYLNKTHDYVSYYKNSF